MIRPPKKEAEFLTLLDEHQNIVHKICRMYTQKESDHKDLFQEISIQLWRSYNRFEGKSKFTTWMYRVGLNTAITLYRKNKKKLNALPLDEGHTHLESESYNPQMDERLNWLYEKIDTFSSIDRALILLFLENKRYDEIAKTLGISKVNARVKMNRLKNRLKEMLKEENNG